MTALKEPSEGSYVHYAESYPSVLLSGLQDLRTDKSLCDVTLCVATRKYAAHKVILCAASSYFKAMFTGSLSERDKQEVEIHDMSAHIFETLLDFIYTGRVCVTVSHCQDLLSAADLMGLSDVIEGCCLFMQRYLQPDNSIGILLFAEAHGCASLYEASENFIYAHFMEVVSEDEFKNSPLELVTKLLHSENLRVEQEIQVLEAGLSWLYFDVLRRRISIYAVMDAIRFPLVPTHQLERTVRECTDISIKVALQKLVQDWRGPRSVNLQPAPARAALFKPCLFQPRKHSLKNIYVIGGYARESGGRWSDSTALCQVEYFNTFQQSWIKSVPLRHARSGHGVAVVNGLIYVVGGESDSLIFDNTECFDPSTGRWTSLASMTLPRCGLGVCTLQGNVYAVGGWVGAVIGDTVERYEPQLGTWTSLDKMATARFAMGVTSCDGQIYVVGGLSELGLEMSVLESYNPVTREWQALAPMPTPRAHVSVVAIDNMLYAVGGANNAGAALTIVESYSVDEDYWAPVASMKHARAAASVAAVNGFLYVMGGRSAGSDFSAPATLDSVECFDPSNDSWLELASMPTGRCEAAVAVL